MRNEIRSLINEAKSYWGNNESIPLDLFAQLNELGVDVERLERHYLRYE